MKTKKKRSSPKMEYIFFPNSGEDQKKGLHQKWNTFSPNSSTDLRSDAHQSQIIGGDAGEDHTQNVGGGIQSHHWGEYIPPSPPGFGTPEQVPNQNTVRFELLS